LTSATYNFPNKIELNKLHFIAQLKLIKEKTSENKKHSAPTKSGAGERPAKTINSSANTWNQLNLSIQ